MIKRKDLTEEQEDAFQHIISFISSTDRQMILTGYAGTGKTTLMRVVLDYLEYDKGYSVVCTAPTNEAVRVIASTTGRDFNSTIYSLLGLALIHEDDKEPILRPQGTSKIGEYEIIIIDESSMIHEELFNLIQEELNSHSYVKVIFVGDSAQLPPVKDKNKESKVFSIQNKTGLVSVQRVAKDSPIINVVTNIRNNLLSPIDTFDRVTQVDEDNNGIIFHDNRDDFLELMYDQFRSEQYKLNNNFVRAIAYTNKAVNALNTHIRRKLFESNELDEYVVGENLIVDSPIVETVGRVSKILFSVGERLRVRRCTLHTDDEFGFKYWRLAVINYEDAQPVSTAIKVIHKDSLKHYHSVLAELAKQSKQKAFTKNSSGRLTFTKGEAWKPYFDFKNQYSWVKYSYALTVHKSQGSTVRNVYVIERDLNKLTWDDEERNKLKYVAFTRASHTLRILQ